MISVKKKKEEEKRRERIQNRNEVVGQGNFAETARDRGPTLPGQWLYVPIFSAESKDFLGGALPSIKLFDINF